MNRAEVLAKAHECITVDRAATYGEAATSFGRIADFWSSYLGHEVKPHDVAMMMVLLKVSRVCGDASHEDSYIDGAGYFALGAEISRSA